MPRFLLVFVAFTLLVLTGCGATNRQPRYEVLEPLEITPFKRYMAHPSQDFLFTWKRKAYHRVDEPIRKHITESKQGVLERHGQPDYVRNSFKATTGELVDEWAWWDRSIVTQFVQDELVYEGELTDMDRYRIRFGYPRRAWQQMYEKGARRDMWDYQGFLFDTQGMMVTFTDERLVSRQSY